MSAQLGNTNLPAILKPKTKQQHIPRILDIETARKCLRYENGQLFLRKPVGHNNEGRMKVKVNNHIYMASKVVWLLHYGEWPKGTLKHLDGNNFNIAIKNLALK